MSTSDTVKNEGQNSVAVNTADKKQVPLEVEDVSKSVFIKKKRKPTRQEQLGEDIAYGLEQTLICFATDFIDPVVGGKMQHWHDKWKTLDKKEPWLQRFKSCWSSVKKMPADHHAEHPVDEHGPSNAHKHAWWGEILGDSAAFVAFIGMRQFMPQPINWMKKAALSVGNKFYEKAGKKDLKQWAFTQGVDESSPQYQERLRQWKDYQAENFAKSSTISFWSTVLNVGTQKFITDNERPLSVITASKLVGATVTWAGMVGLRFLMPRTMEEMDEELARKYFNPIIHKTSNLLGFQPEKKEDHLVSNAGDKKETPKTLTQMPTTSQRLEQPFATEISSV